MSNFPIWYKLVHHWCIKKHRSGRSIPFIIGVHGGTVVELLLEISNSDFGEKVILKFCDDINAYVLGFDDNINPISPYLTGFGNLYLYNHKLEAFGSLDKIANYLSDLHKEPIEGKKFSRNGFLDTWEPYNDEDLKLINEALSAPLN